MFYREGSSLRITAEENIKLKDVILEIQQCKAAIHNCQNEIKGLREIVGDTNIRIRENQRQPKADPVDYQPLISADNLDELDALLQDENIVSVCYRVVYLCKT